MNVVIVNGSSQYRTLFESMGHTLTNAPIYADLVVFTGGADVTPDMYGAKAHPWTGNDVSRDAEEAIIFNQCVKFGIPMVGICRGGQFLNVMSGGSMYQHVEEHTRSHLLTDVETGETVYVSSTHHQMIKPSPKAVLVATAALQGERQWYEGQVFYKDISKEDIEVVFYPETKCLCFQPHPEFNSPEYEGMKQYFKGLLARYLDVK